MKNIDDDYLWDRSGDPDPEIQELEQLLATLRYQPRPLDIPAGLAPSQKRSSFPSFLAIAATMVMMLFGVGLWLGLRRQPTREVAKGGDTQVTTTSAKQKEVPVPDKDNGLTAVSPTSEPDHKAVRDRGNREGAPRELARSRRPTMTTPELTAEEIKEAEAGKAQLMLALRVASSKLSFAQKKAQEINSENQVHNQHKIG
jgi:hypothetical protein